MNGAGQAVLDRCEHIIRDPLVDGDKKRLKGWAGHELNVLADHTDWPLNIGRAVSTASGTVNVGGNWHAPRVVRIAVGWRRRWWRWSHGGNVEGHGTDPDVDVPLDPFMWRQGRDSQLEKAIAIINDQMKNYPPLPNKKPAYPDKSKVSGG